MLVMEFAARHNWSRLWLESDSSCVVHAFKNHSAIPMRFRNRWHNCMQLGLFVICSHIYMEGNCCDDALASLGHDLPDTTWFHILPTSLSMISLEIEMGCPTIDYRSLFCLFFSVLLLLCFEGIGLVPPPLYGFSPFFNNITTY